MPKIMLSPNDPSFFEPVLSPNAPACRSAGLTPVSISNMTAPPGFGSSDFDQISPACGKHSYQGITNGIFDFYSNQ